MIAGRGTAMLAGPAGALGDHPDRRATVVLTEPVPGPDLGAAVRRVDVGESGRRHFVVPWHRTADGRLVAVNPAGGNQVSWAEPARDDFRLTPATGSHLTAVHVRFVLRHLTTALLSGDLGGRAVHAVTATLVGQAGAGCRRVLAVAGPTRSGKTGVVNRLIVAGLATAVVDDDCPVLGAGGRLTTLVPRYHEVAPAVGTELAVLVLLCDGAARVRAVDHGTAHEFLAGTPTAFPAAWLPVPPAPVAAVLPALPDELLVLEAPARDERAYREIIEFVSASRS